MLAVAGSETNCSWRLQERDSPGGQMAPVDRNISFVVYIAMIFFSSNTLGLFCQLFSAKCYYTLMFGFWISGICLQIRETGFIKDLCRKKFMRIPNLSTLLGHSAFATIRSPSQKPGLCMPPKSHRHSGSAKRCLSSGTQKPPFRRSPICQHFSNQ